MKKLFLSTLTLVAVVALIGGATYAVFTASKSMDGNTISTAEVSIDFNSIIEKPLTATNLVPGEYTDWAKIGVWNRSSVPVTFHMYVDITKNDNGVCSATDLELRTGWAGGDEKVRGIYDGPIMNLVGEANAIELTGNPPFEYAGLNITQVIWQQAQLTEAATNDHINSTCEWNEVFVAKTIAPAMPE